LRRYRIAAMSAKAGTSFACAAPQRRQGDAVTKLVSLFKGLALAALLATPLAAAEVPASPLPYAPGVTPIAPAFTAQGRPRIGLVLGGGGAKGFAHIGVIEELERLHIPVDVIAGTSMGAVVGSMYAIGNDASQVNAIAHNIDWNTVFNDSLSRNQLSFRRKQEDRRILLPYRLGIKDGKPVLPQGMLGGQKLYATVQELTSDWLTTTDFDKLPIPYRAVATNIGTGDPVVMGSGLLSTAVFASMSIPGGFPPVEREGLLLVDGGISDNVPINVARAMGVDVVIVVDVGQPPTPVAKITNAVDVINQMQLLLGYAAVREQRASLSGRDVLIEPDITGLSTTGFDKLDLGIERGLEASKKVEAKLAALSVSDAQWAQYLAERKARTNPAPIIVDRVVIANTSKTPTKEIEKLVTQKSGQPLDSAMLKTDVQKIYDMDAFSRVDYTVSGAPGDTVLTIDTKGNAAEDRYFQVGLLIASDFGKTTQFDIALAYTDRDFLGTGAEWRGFARIGNNILFDVSLYKQFGNFFVEPVAFYQRDAATLIRVGSLNENETVQVVRGGAGFDFGMVFGNWGELRLGGTLGGLNIVDSSFDTGIPPGWNTDTTIGAGFTVDTLDDVVFPKHGVFARLEYVDHLPALGGDFTRNQLSFDLAKPFTFGRTTILVGGRVGTTFDAAAGSYDANIGDFRLGGFLNLSGTQFNSLIGQQLLFGRIVGYHRISEQSPILNLPIFIGGSLEAGNVWSSKEDISFSDLTVAGSAFIGADTPIGPMWLAYGQSSEGGAIYLVIGRLF
jgi:NTE family protein